MDTFREDPVALGDAAWLYLNSEWANPRSRSVIEDNIEAADENLALVETGILALVAMYGLYLIVTRGIVKETVRTTRKKDGSETSERITQKATFAEPVRGLLGLFIGPLGNSTKAAEEKGK